MFIFTYNIYVQYLLYVITHTHETKEKHFFFCLRVTVNNLKGSKNQFAIPMILCFNILLYQVFVICIFDFVNKTVEKIIILHRHSIIKFNNIQHSGSTECSTSNVNIKVCKYIRNEFVYILFSTYYITCASVSRELLLFIIIIKPLINIQ